MKMPYTQPKIEVLGSIIETRQLPNKDYGPSDGFYFNSQGICVVGTEDCATTSP